MSWTSLVPQELQPANEAAEVADGGEDCIAGIALAVPEVIATHAMLGLEVADHGLDSRAPA